MKALQILAVLAFAMLSDAASGDNPSTDDALAQVRALINERFPRIEPESVRPSEVPGMFEIQQGPLVAYISKDGRYLIQGNIIDLERDVDLTEQSMANGRRKVIEELPVKGIVFGPDNPKHTVTVFTDIDCTFCRKLHREIESYNAAGIAVRYLMYPRSGPNTRSWEKAEEVWCAADQQDAMTRAKNDQRLPAASCDTTPIREHFQAGLGVGLSGTPAILLDDGTLISGYVPAADLLAQLENVPSGDSGDR